MPSDAHHAALIQECGSGSLVWSAAALRQRRSLASGLQRSDALRTPVRCAGFVPGPLVKRLLSAARPAVEELGGRSKLRKRKFLKHKILLPKLTGTGDTIMKQQQKTLKNKHTSIFSCIHVHWGPGFVRKFVCTLGSSLRCFLLCLETEYIYQNDTPVSKYIVENITSSARMINGAMFSSVTILVR